MPEANPESEQPTERKSFPAPRCPICNARLSILREYMWAAMPALCESGHRVDVWFDHDAEEWKSRAASSQPFVSRARG